MLRKYRTRVCTLVMYEASIPTPSLAIIYKTLHGVRPAERADFMTRNSVKQDNRASHT